MRRSQGRFDEFGSTVLLDENGDKLADLLCSRVIRETSRVNRAYVEAIDVDVLDNDSFNAIAAADPQGEGVALFKGLPETLIRASAGWMSSDIGWKDIGVLGSGTIGSLPADRRRAVFAVEAAKTAIHFALAHEYAHILRGHLDYLSALYGARNLAEVAERRGGGAPATLLRVLEADADTMAAVSQADNLTAALSNPTELGKHELLKAQLFGLGLLFALMAESERRCTGVSERTHPKPHIRYFLVGPRIREIVTATHPDVFACGEPERQVYDELKQMFRSLWSTDVRPEIVVRTSELQELIDGCARLEPQFLKVAHERIAAKQQHVADGTAHCLR